MLEAGKEGAHSLRAGSSLPPPGDLQLDVHRVPKRRTRTPAAAGGPASTDHAAVDAATSDPHEAPRRKRRRTLEAGGASGELSSEAMLSIELPQQDMSSSQQEGAPGGEEAESTPSPRASDAAGPACHTLAQDALHPLPDQTPGPVGLGAGAGRPVAPPAEALQGTTPPFCTATPPALPSLPEGHPLMLDDLPSSALLHLGHRILTLYKQHHQRQAQRTQQAAQQQQQEQQEEQMADVPPPPQRQQPLLRPSTPVQHSWGGATGPAAPGGNSGGALEEAYRRFARYDEEVGALRVQLAAAQRALSAQEGARVALAAELEWAREAAAGAQVQRGAMEVLMAKNAELQEQVRTLGSRQHMLQQQLVAAMAARERRHAEAQALAADKEGLQALLAEGGARQRALHVQVAALEGRCHRVEQELSGVRAARDWLAPRLEAALAEKTAVEEELRATRGRLECASAELVLWRAQARQGGGGGAGCGGSSPGVAP